MVLLFPPGQPPHQTLKYIKFGYSLNQYGHEQWWVPKLPAMNTQGPMNEFMLARTYIYASKP